MMISRQTICAFSPRLPLLGTCIKSLVSLSSSRRLGQADRKWSSGLENGGSSSASRQQASPSKQQASSPKQRASSSRQQASSFSSGSDNACDGGVHVKDAGSLRHFNTGINTLKLMDQSSIAKRSSAINDQLPPLRSMIIDGLPPLQQSKYVHEAEKCLQKYVKHYHNVKSLDSYCHVGLCIASYLFPRVVGLDRLVAISINYALHFLLDDLLFDIPNEFLQDQYGISQCTRESPEKIQEYLDHINAVFSQQVQPSDPASLMEIMMWESGRDMLELSNPEWFHQYVSGIVESNRISVASHADILQGRNMNFQDLESYTIMRAGNFGGKFAQLTIEFANNSYIPSTLKTSSYLENVTMATSIHLGLANDVFSYHKEILFEENPRNLITILMEHEGRPFVQTMHMAIELVNKYANTILDLESQAWNSSLQNHLQDIKALIAGNIYYSFVERRYRHPNSIFPELRDMTKSWKILPYAEGLGP